MEQSQIKEKINEALQQLRNKDSLLLINDLSERTICHKLAIYIENLFEDWDVDCEYNKIPTGCKILDLIPRGKSNSEETRVYPDIIVHKRNTDDNFIVIEIKKSTNNKQSEVEFDKTKLNLYKEQLGYRFAIFINITTGRNYSSPENEIIFI